MSRCKVGGLAVATALAAAALVPAAGSATATKAGTYKVKPDKLYVYEEPGKVYEGVLFKDNTFVVKKLSASGKYAYGKANGHVDKMGWVKASELKR